VTPFSSRIQTQDLSLHGIHKKSGQTPKMNVIVNSRHFNQGKDFTDCEGDCLPIELAQVSLQRKQGEAMTIFLSCENRDYPWKQHGFF